MSERLDTALVERGLVPTRSRARDLILRGLVAVDGRIVTKPGATVTAVNQLNVEGPAAYVSRGALKLEAALDAFGFDIRDRICLDVGSSTGGFTEVLLRRGASKVYALDVGRDQLHENLRTDPRVVVLESTDARDITRELIPDDITALVSDVSFISLEKALPRALERTVEGAILAVLVKPQFEAGRDAIGKGGIVKDQAVRDAQADKIARWIGSLPGWTVKGVMPSPIAGGSGNQEFILGAIKMGNENAIIREVEITRLGAKGDGMMSLGGETVFVANALPGDRWRLGGASGNELLSGMPRASPLCPHYGTCGGCMSQHMPADVYANWKRALVVDAFAHRGIEADVLPVFRVKTSSRRRAFFGIERKGSLVRIGFREEGQHTLVDIEACAVLDPLIVKALPLIREMAKIAIPERTSGRLVVTRLDHGLDVSFESARKDLNPQDRSDLARYARELKLVRLWAAGEPIFEAGSAIVTLSDVEVEIPPGVFLQAVPEAEQKLAGFVASALPKKAKSAVDLFSGVGTLAFPLARRMAVTAFDSDKRAITALQGAVRKAQGLKPIDARVRDLFREPLSVREIDGFDVIVFDPPRAGAAEQAERIAKSKAKTVIAISCNPATLARDARMLLDGGYKMGAVLPIDQFLFSTHIEAATVFTR